MTQPTPQDALLTDLCGICHNNPIKYTCPRCAIHTCSLPCVKRHKLWAQCSGVRDPAAFKKRQELASPSSIDQDYNFITKVERSLQRADDDAADKGIDLAPAGTVKSWGKPKAEAESEKDGIVIVKAPKGLSRSKQNKSHWNARQNCMLWTIEWRLPDEKKVFANTQSTRSIVEAYRNSVGRKNTPRKRPREEIEIDSAKVGKETVPQDTAEQDASPKQKEVIKQEEAKGTEEATLQVGPSSPAQAGQNPRGPDDNETKIEKQATTTASSPTVIKDLHFYLHRPDTRSKDRCLIPLSQLETIGEALRNKTLLEFPTIYVLFEPPENLVPPFVTEAEYLQKHGSDLPVNMPSYGTTEPEEGDVTARPDTLDEQKVLEVLQKDIGG